MQTACLCTTTQEPANQTKHRRKNVRICTYSITLNIIEYPLNSIYMHLTDKKYTVFVGCPAPSCQATHAIHRAVHSRDSAQGFFASGPKSISWGCPTVCGEVQRMTICVILKVFHQLEPGWETRQGWTCTDSRCQWSCFWILQYFQLGNYSKVLIKLCGLVLVLGEFEYSHLTLCCKWQDISQQPSRTIQ